MNRDTTYLDWLESEAPLQITRTKDGGSEVVEVRDGEHVLGTGPTLRDAVWNAMRGDST